MRKLKKDELFFDPGTPVHWEVNLYRALCGDGWIQVTGDKSLLTCKKCIELLKRGNSQ